MKRHHSVRALLATLLIASGLVVIGSAPVAADRGVSGDVRIAAMSARLTAGGDQSCVLLDSGDVSCWGMGYGVLGYGNLTVIGDSETPAQNPVNNGMVPLPGGAKATVITSGFGHTCALLTTGDLTCWGYGPLGRLGYGNENTIGDGETPAQNPVNGGIVPMPGGQKVAAVAGGGEHTCALLASGQVTCWGGNSSGQLGYGNTATIGDTETPAQNPINGGIVALPGNTTATAITAGGNHTCALLTGGDITCWGAGNDGRLGYGNTNAIGDTGDTPATNPVSGGLVPLPGGLKAVAVSAGERHTCAILTNATLTCWGYNFSGQLGYGNTDNIGDTVGDTPATNPVNGGLVALPGGQTSLAVSAGFDHTCAVLANGQIACWGYNFDGQLGYGNTNNIGDDETAAVNPVNNGVVPVPGGQGAVAVSSGKYHTCALLSGGQVTCWGLGLDGRLGYGNTSNIGDNETPAANSAFSGYVPLPAGRAVVDVAPGGSHTCALLASGQVSCWGYGDAGRTGLGSTVTVGDDETPAASPVAGGIVALPGGQTATAVSTGQFHSCALLASGGVSCWGRGDLGQLGYGNTTQIGDNETPAANPVNGGIVPLPGGRSAVAVEVGNFHTCALLDNGGVTCWGLGMFGRLGYGNTENIGNNETPAANPVNGGIVPLPGGRRAVAIDLDGFRSCAILDDGHVVCWGSGAAGQLGYGNTDNIGDDETPATNPAHGGLVPLPGGLRAAAIGGGSSHTCVLLVSLQVTCFGSNGEGQLGYGNTTDIGDNETPAQNPVNGGIVPLPGGQLATAVTLGSQHTCALLTSGGVTCWGRSDFGQLGYGNTTQIGVSLTPATNPANGGIVELPGAQAAAAVRAGDHHTCAVLVDQRLTCWGAADNGKLGYGNLVRIGDTEPPAANPVDGGIVALPNPVRPNDLIPLTPARLVDTRPGFTTIDGVLQGGGTRSAGSTLTVAVAGRGGVPRDATAAVLSISAVTPAANGFITTYPCDQPRPTAANLNYQSGATVANTAIAKLSVAGTVCIFTNQAIDLVVDVNAATPPSSALTGVTPARLADTRPGQTTLDDLFNGEGTRSAGSTLTLTVAGRGPVPAAARTVALNVSAVTPAANGFLTIYPCDQAQPTASSLNYRAGTTTANFVYATTGAAGTICIFTNQATDLVVDVVAYHRTGLPAPSRHHPLPPSRLVDTRPGFATADGRFAGAGTRAAGSTLVLQIARRFPAGNARLASLNVTAVNPAANGFITIYPCDQPQPVAATFNYRTGITRSVGTLATLSARGTVCIFTNRATDLVVDINGTTL